MADEVDHFSEDRLKSFIGRTRAIQEAARLAKEARQKELSVEVARRTLRTLVDHPRIGKAVEETCRAIGFNLEWPEKKTVLGKRGRTEVDESLGGGTGAGPSDPNLQPPRSIGQSKAEKVDVVELEKERVKRLLRGVESKATKRVLRDKRKELEAEAATKEAIEEALELIRQERLQAERASMGPKFDELAKQIKEDEQE